MEPHQPGPAGRFLKKYTDIGLSSKIILVIGLGFGPGDSNVPAGEE